MQSNKLTEIFLLYTYLLSQSDCFMSIFEVLNALGSISHNNVVHCGGTIEENWRCIETFFLLIDLPKVNFWYSNLQHCHHVSHLIDLYSNFKGLLTL